MRFLMFLIGLTLVSLDSRATPGLMPLGETTCSVHGTFSSAAGSSFESLQKMIRRRFQVTNMQECVKAVEQYCRQARQTAGVTPKNMKGGFRLNKQVQEQTFNVNPDCAIIVVE